jgi:hypothetical protein
MEFPNRKQRRLWEKQSGMLKKKKESTFKEQMAISKRAAEVGKQIHIANIERDLRKIEAEKAEILNQQIAEKMSQGMTLEQATEVIREESGN